MKSQYALLLVGAVLTCNVADAAYTRATSGPVTVTQIYTNELGSPFVWFSAAINSACAGGDALYLDDVTQTQPNAQYQNNKLAVLLSAEAQGKEVVLDYFYDPTVAGWGACYIEGIYLQK